MTGKKKSKRTISSNRTTFVGDITLGDFANAESPRGRVKKSNDSLVAGVQQLKIEDEPQAVLIDSGDDIRDEKSQRKKKLVKKVLVSGGRTYPIDIWYILSKYIRPEDVCTFACICKSTHHVVCTVTFWMHLYKSFNPDMRKTPALLKPDRLIHNRGLRVIVIRALYIMYKPLVERSKSKMIFEADPRQLIKRQCVLLWHEKAKNNNWIYWFKLQKTDSSNSRAASIYKNFPEKMLGVCANTEEGCKCLKVSCPSYNPPPMVLGQTLMSVSLTLDHSLRNRIQLVFGSGPRNVVDYNSTTFTLNPVSQIHVLDWWHPLYPYPYSQVNTSDDF
ncbi:transmembrane protein 183 [Nilaparvata lugens]|uniref:transmembrane protein 183 n=1 Tax=Nilaparvata lugens TaxID=108931 RepID=UPI00193E74FE|nr:transmembrane protein 183 [Nilaparvata lugens]